VDVMFHWFLHGHPRATNQANLREFRAASIASPLQLR
jgi:hypothetical protein